MKKTYGLLLASSLVLAGAGAASLLFANKANETRAATLPAGHIFIGGADLSTKADYKVTGGSGYAQFDPSTNTLTFNNYTYTGCSWVGSPFDAALCVKLTDDFTKTINFNLVGTSTITSLHTTDNNSQTMGTYIEGMGSSGDVVNVNISGTGTLKSIGGTNDNSGSPKNGITYGWQSGQRVHVNISSGTLQAIGGKATVDLYGSESIGFWNEYGAEVNLSGGRLDAIGGECWDVSRGFHNYYGGKFTGGTFNATGGNAIKSYGMTTYTNFAIDGAIFTATGGATKTREGWSSLSYGIYTQNPNRPDTDPYIFNVTDKTTSVTLKGNTSGLYGKLFNKIIGYQYTNTAGTAGEKQIDVKSSEADYKADTYKNLQFKACHTSQTNYTVNATYDKTDKAIAPTVTYPTSGATIKYRSSTTESWGNTRPTCVEPGTYTYHYQVSASKHTSAEGKITVNVTKAKASWDTNPVVATDLVYNGTEQDLLTNLGAATGGTIQYKVDDGEYSTNAPKGTEAKTYSLRFHIEPDDTHEAVSDIVASATIAPAEMEDVDVNVKASEFVYDGEPVELEVETAGETVDGTEITFSYSLDGDNYGDLSGLEIVNAGTHRVYWKAEAENHETITGYFDVAIGKGSSSYVSEPTSINNLSYTGKPQELVKAGKTNDGEVVYSLTGEEDSFVSELPTATDSGTYTVYYKIAGDDNHNDSEVKTLKVTISPVDKEALKNKIDEAEQLYESIKDSYPEVAKVLGDAIDEATYVYDNDNVTKEEVIEAIKVLEDAINQALEDSRDIIVDEESGVTIQTKDGTGIPTNINLKVEVKTSVKAEEGTSEYERIKSFLVGKEHITNVFDIKLVKTEGDKEIEIQPSDIKKGLALIVHVELPEGINTETLKLLHIHSDGDIELVEEFKIDGNEVTFELSSLSELALIQPVNTALPGWAIALIVIGSVLLLLCLLYILMFCVFGKWTDQNGEAKRIAIVGKRDETKKVMFMNLKCGYRIESRIFKTKEEAEQALKK